MRIRTAISRSLLTVAVVGLGLALTPRSAAAGEIFGVDATAFGGGIFTADIIHGGYDEILTVTSFDGTNGTFETVAYWNAGSFEQNDAPVFGTGLNNTYGMYALFSAEGTFTTNGSGGYEFTATVGNIEVWIDVVPPQTDLTLPATGTGGIGSIGVADGATDVKIATADLVSGDGDTSGGAAEGNFDLTFNPFVLTSPDGEDFFYAPDPFWLTVILQGNFNEFDPLIANQTLEGSANAQFIPEPATLTLLGLGLMGSGVVARRRRKADQPVA